MERTTKPVGKRRRLINENLLISHNVVEKILRKENPDALSLYIFYVKTGNTQHTTSPRANESFSMNGTSLGRTRFRNAKKVLEGLNLIRISQSRMSETSFGECFVQLLHYHYSGVNQSVKNDMRSVESDLSLINKEEEADFWENLKCGRCGTPLFTSDRSIPGRSISTHKYKEDNKMVISPEDSITKKEEKKKPLIRKTIPPNKVCPYGHIFGKEAEYYPNQCNECDVKQNELFCICLEYTELNEIEVLKKHSPDKTI